MTSRCNCFGFSQNLSQSSSSLEEGKITTEEGIKIIQPLSLKSKCALVAFAVGGLAGVVFVVLGATHLFGPVGSIGFIVSIAGGGTVAMIATGGMIWIARSKNEIILKKTVVPKDTAYSPIGEAAIEFARQKLREHSKISPSYSWGENAHQPVNPEIPFFQTLYILYSQKFTEALKKHPNNPWAQEEVIQAVDAYMKIAYAISCLTLEDLSGFTGKLAQEGRVRTYAQALVRQDSYLYRTFYRCTAVYHWIRGEMMWCMNQYTQKEGCNYPANEISEQHAQLFYQEGTVQHNWRMLYNDYCDRVRLYVDEDELRDADGRFVNWTQKDEGPHTFRKVPDTQPT